MSYPQPKSSVSVLQGQDYYRLFTELQSNGDIYEIDTSVKGLVIGPNSDIQNVRIFYYDQQSPGHIESALVSVGDPYIGRIDARMDSVYPQLGTRARLLVTADDIVPHADLPFNIIIPSFVPYQPATDLLTVNRPKLDLIAYHSDPPSIPLKRSERRWMYSVVALDRGNKLGISWYLFPHYRRKYFNARFVCVTGNQVTGASFQVYGITFYPSSESGATASTSPRMGGVRLTVEAISVTLGATAEFVLYEERDDYPDPATHAAGEFDYILVTVSGQSTGEDTYPADGNLGIDMSVLSRDSD